MILLLLQDVYIHVGSFGGCNTCKLLFCSAYRGHFNDTWLFTWVSTARSYCVQIKPWFGQLGLKI